MNYIIPAKTRIGHIHLKVSNLDKALAFYQELLGFQITQRYGNQAVFISAGGYHHHIGLNTWHSKNAPPPPMNSCGLYHTAIVFETRREFAIAVSRVLDAGYPITGAADHGVSEAVYLDDPDGNGVELYWDRPAAEWPRTDDGAVQMVTLALNMPALLAETGDTKAS